MLILFGKFYFIKKKNTAKISAIILLLLFNCFNFYYFYSIIYEIYVNFTCIIKIYVLNVSIFDFKKHVFLLYSWDVYMRQKYSWTRIIWVLFANILTMLPKYNLSFALVLVVQSHTQLQIYYEWWCVSASSCVSSIVALYARIIW